MVVSERKQRLHRGPSPFTTATTTLARQRVNRGWSLRHVQRLMGISYTSLQAYEHKREIPTVLMALKLARLYDATVEELFGWTLEQPHE